MDTLDTPPHTPDSPALDHSDFDDLTKEKLVDQLKAALAKPQSSHDRHIISYTLATVSLIEAWHNWHCNQNATERLHTLWQAEDAWRSYRNLSPHSILRIRLEHKAWLVFHHTCSLAHIESHIPPRP